MSQPMHVLARSMKAEEFFSTEFMQAFAKADGFGVPPGVDIKIRDAIKKLCTEIPHRDFMNDTTGELICEINSIKKPLRSLGLDEETSTFLIRFLGAFELDVYQEKPKVHKREFSNTAEELIERVS